MPGWLDLKHAAQYSCLSVQTLRRHLLHATHPLPARLVGGKWLIAPVDLDRWVQSFPRAGEAADKLVERVIRELRR